MNKIKMLILIILLFVVTDLEAKWRPLSEKELIKDTELIVFAKLIRIEKLNGRNKFEKTQRVYFTKIKTIKGEVSDDFVVRGRQVRMCVPQCYFNENETGRFLLFLSKRNSIYHIRNGNFGALKEINGKVRWFKDDEKNRYSWQREVKDLKKVIKQIKEKLALYNTYESK